MRKGVYLGLRTTTSLITNDTRCLYRLALLRHSIAQRGACHCQGGCLTKLTKHLLSRSFFIVQLLHRSKPISATFLYVSFVFFIVGFKKKMLCILPLSQCLISGVFFFFVVVFQSLRSFLHCFNVWYISECCYSCFDVWYILQLVTLCLCISALHPLLKNARSLFKHIIVIFTSLVVAYLNHRRQAMLPPMCFSFVENIYVNYITSIIICL